MPTVTIRPATAADAAEMLAIYAPYVSETTISSEYEPPAHAEFVHRIETCSARLPWLICRIDGVAAGYGYAAPHRTRAGYQWSAETSIYVAPAFHRRGVAAAIYRAIFALLTRQGYYDIFVGINAPNERSVHFHTAMGYTISGVYRASMFKFGQWRDVIWMKKSLRPHTGTPAPTIPFPALRDDGETAALLEKEAGTVRAD